MSYVYTICCCLIYLQEVKSLRPCVHAAHEDSGLLNYQETTYTVYLDEKPIFVASTLANAFIGATALCCVFGVHYPRSLKKTCTFLWSHVLGFKEAQVSSVQSLYNKLAA